MRLPLRTRWSTTTDLGPISLSPASDGTVVVTAGDHGMTGLDARSGAIVWRVPADGTVVDMTCTAFGPVMVHYTEDGCRIVAVDWSGAVLWSAPGGRSMGPRSLRGWGDRLITAGEFRDPDRRLVYRVCDAARGDVLAIHPGSVDLPHPTRFGLLFPVRSSDPAQAGLYLQPFDDRAPDRLLDLSHNVLAVHGDLVVLDTTDGPWEPSELVAYDLEARCVRWRAPGGPILRFGIDDERVVCARFVDVTTGTIACRSRATGALVWETGPLEMTDLTVQLSGERILAEIGCDLLWVLDLRTGERLQEMEALSTLTYGPRLTAAGVIDAHRADVRCL